MTIWIILIILIIVFRNAKKNQKKPIPKSDGRTFENYGDYKAFEEPKKSYNAEANKPKAATANRMFTRDKGKSVVTSSATPQRDISEKAQNIQDRRIAQHENSKKSRIHNNIHKDDDKDMDPAPSDLMHNIRDLIVCGYPTEIKGQRDFTKEGEDFLNSLSEDSLFF